MSLTYCQKFISRNTEFNNLIIILKDSEQKITNCIAREIALHIRKFKGTFSNDMGVWSYTLKDNCTNNISFRIDDKILETVYDFGYISDEAKEMVPKLILVSWVKIYKKVIKIQEIIGKEICNIFPDLEINIDNFSNFLK